MRTLLGHSSLSTGTIYVDDAGYVCVLHENGESVRIQEGQVGPSAPKIYTATQLGILTANSAAANVAAYEAWATNVTSAYVGSGILFDVLGTYNFDDVLTLPVDRTLRGVSPAFTILKYTGAADLGSETAFITTANTTAYVRDLIISVRDGVTLNGLLDYGFKSEGTLSPNSAGATVYGDRVYIQYAQVANWRSLNAAMILNECRSIGADHGFWLDSCSECELHRCRADNWRVTAVKNRGIYTSGESFVNGGKIDIMSFVGGTNQAADFGIYIEGVANSTITTCTIEGASGDSAYYIKDSTNVHCTKTRSNAGIHVTFDGCVFCSIQGGCTSGQAADGAYFFNDNRNCQAGLCVETDVGHVDVDQHFGAWIGHRRWVGGPMISKANTVPSDGYWIKEDKIDKLTASSGTTEGWVCSATGNPNGGTGAFLARANVA